MEINTSESFKYHFIIWRFTGIIPPKNNYNQFYLIYSILLNIIVTIIFPTTLIINLFFIDNFLEVCENLNITIPDTVSNIKFLNVFIVRKKLKSIKGILQKLDSRVKSSYEKIILLKSIKIAQNSFRAFLMLYSIGTILSFVMVIFSSEKILMYPAWFPLDWKNSNNNFLIVTIYQLFGLSVQAIQNVANDSYPPAHLIILTGHIKALTWRIKNIGRNKKLGIDRNYKDLVQCIQDHQIILELYETIQQIISTACAAQFICTCLVQCTIGIYVLYTDNSSKIPISVIFFIAVTMETYILCYFGNQLTIESEHLSNAIFECNCWIDESKKFKIDMIFYIQRLQKIIQIRAGNYIPISHPTFVKILKFAYSAFTLLRTLKH